VREAHCHSSQSLRGTFVRQSRAIKLMVVVDEYTRRCLAIHVARRIRAKDAIDVFAELMQTHGIPEHIQSDNGSETVAKRLRCWLR